MDLARCDDPQPPVSPKPTQNDFQIGWICALPIELTAANLMLDEEFDVDFEKDRNDSNTYLFGRINKHYVVVACLPNGKYGTNAAAVVAKDMSRTFSASLRIGLLVGIAGGIPSAAYDVRLGDIVVSTPKGASGGVNQYDFKKQLSNGEIRLIGQLNSPPSSFRTAVTTLKSKHRLNRSKGLRFESFIHEALANKHLPEYARPDIASDRLFKPTYAHVSGSETCQDCLQAEEEKRKPREPRQRDRPVVHYGIIASGNTLMRDAVQRDEIGAATGAICFEMEAAGLMNNFPCLVIRGVSDYADSHKNKLWKGYAALVAAAYAKELLTYLQPTDLARTQMASETLST